MREERRSRRAAGTLAVIAGLAAGTIASSLGALTGGEGAEPAGMRRAAGSPTTPGMSQPKLALLHTPPLLVLRTEAVELRYRGHRVPARRARRELHRPAAAPRRRGSPGPLVCPGAATLPRWLVVLLLRGHGRPGERAADDRAGRWGRRAAAGLGARPATRRRARSAPLRADQASRGGGRPGGVGSRRRRARPARRPRAGNRRPFLVRRRERWLGAHPRPGQPPPCDLPAGHGDPPGPGRAAGHLRGHGRPGDPGRAEPCTCSTRDVTARWRCGPSAVRAASSGPPRSPAPLSPTSSARARTALSSTSTRTRPGCRPRLPAGALRVPPSQRPPLAPAGR